MNRRNPDGPALDCGACANRRGIPTLRISAFLALAFLSFWSPAFSENSPAARARRRLVFNEDGQVLVEAPTTGTSAFVKAWLDREAATVPFTTFVFDSALPDICTYETRIGEVFGARFPADFKTGWAPAIRALRAEGTDSLRVVTAHMKAKGLEVLAGIRMNDTHHRLTADMPLCPQFALDHPEYVIRQPDGRTNESALDYSYPEVRSHRLAIMREIVEGYDVDGLELNFVRWAKHFPRDKGREKAPILTSFMGEIRKTLDAAAKKRSRSRLTIGARVPESIHTCWLAGIDIESWIKSGWFDYIVLSTFNNTDPQLPVGEFTRFTKPVGLETIVSMGQMMGSVTAGPPAILDRGIAMAGKQDAGYTGMLLTAAEARAAAANFYAWGADGISFWNVGIHFGSRETATPEQRERIRQWTSAVQNPESVYAGPRIYRFLPMGKGLSSRKPPARNYPWYDENHSPLGQPNSPVLEFIPEKIGRRLVFPFRIAEGTKGESLNGLVRFWIYHVSQRDEVQVDVNGRKINPARIRQVDPSARRGGLPGVQYEIALSDCLPLRGNNELGLLLSSSGDRKAIPYMEELEVTVDTPVHLPLKAQNLPVKADWRDDAANIEIVRQINRAYLRIPFSTQYEGVLDDCPYEIDWTVGPDIPYPWKGGISGVFGDEVILAGGHWGDGKPHTFVFQPKTGAFREIAPYPVATQFSQGDADTDNLYLIGGKIAGQMAVKLSRSPGGQWQWTNLPPVPESNRWTSSVNAAGKWLLLFAGCFLGGGSPLELPAWRLRVDTPDPKWEPMASYPGGERAVVTTAIANGKIYAFGGWRVDKSLEAIGKELDLRKKFGLWFYPPNPSVIGFRDAYRYDPQSNRWQAIRNLPFPMYGGKGILMDDRYILIMGTSSLQRSLRVGRSNPESAPPFNSQVWLGYDDVILCYDIQRDNYSRVGAMLYGVSSWNWARVGNQLFCFGGEPSHGLNSNRENVLQIGTIRARAPGHP